MLSGTSLGICDVPSVRGAALCFSRGTDWPGDPGLVALLWTIVGGAALGWGVYWVMYGALVAGPSSWHTCVVNLPNPLAFGQSTSWHPTGQGFLLATLGSLDIMLSIPSSDCVLSGQKPKLMPQLGDLPCLFEITQNT